MFAFYLKQTTMAKIAKLVLVSLMTRVIVEDTATAEEIVAAAKPNIQAKLDNNELYENTEEIMDDTEMPYDPNIELTPEELAILKKREDKNKFGG